MKGFPRHSSEHLRWSEKRGKLGCYQRVIILSFFFPAHSLNRDLLGHQAPPELLILLDPQPLLAVLPLGLSNPPVVIHLLPALRAHSPDQGRAVGDVLVSAL